MAQVDMVAECSFVYGNSEQFPGPSGYSCGGQIVCKGCVLPLELNGPCEEVKAVSYAGDLEQCSL